jgi:predicted DNA-binding protein
MLKTYATKLEERQVEELKKLSEQTKIPQAELVRQAVELLLKQWKTEQERLEFLKRVDQDLEEDREALQRLAQL